MGLRRTLKGVAKVGSKVATAVSVLALATSCTSSDGSEGDSESPGPSSSVSASTNPADPAATDPTASIPPRPQRTTIRTVRRKMLAQRFRPYSGATPPRISKAEALQRGRYTDDYSLGLWDVGMVHSGPFFVTWRHVWVIAAERYYENLSEMSLGGPVQPDAPPEPNRPGWVSYITMLDARTGSFVLEYSFDRVGRG